MLLIIPFLSSLICGYYLAFKLTNNKRKSICAAIILGFIGLTPATCSLIIAIAVMSIVADILKK